MSFQAKITKILLRLHFYRMLRNPYQKQRQIQTNFSRLTTRISKDIVFKSILAGQVSAEWVRAPKSKDNHVILYFHGGAYFSGSIITHRDYAARLAMATEMCVLLVDYRLAPEHPYPAAVEDAVEVFQWLLDEGYDPTKMIIAGDSAGGGLALATLVSLRDAGVILPAGAVCLSPWIDLTLAGESMTNKETVDFICRPDVLRQSAQMYAGNHDLKTPLISPLFADLQNLPPLLIHVGTEETLLDDSTRLAAWAGEAGADVDLHIWPGMFHMFQLVGYLPEAKKVLVTVRDFVEKRVLVNK
jgi:acetyl esterase/lipase